MDNNIKNDWMGGGEPRTVVSQSTGDSSPGLPTQDYKYPPPNFLGIKEEPQGDGVSSTDTTTGNSSSNEVKNEVTEELKPSVDADTYTSSFLNPLLNAPVKTKYPTTSSSQCDQQPVSTCSTYTAGYVRIAPKPCAAPVGLGITTTNALPPLLPAVNANLYPVTVTDRTTTPSTTVHQLSNLNPCVYHVTLRPAAPNLVPATNPCVNPVTFRPIAPNLIPAPKPSVNPVTLRPIAPNLIPASKRSVNPVTLRPAAPNLVPATNPCVNPGTFRPIAPNLVPASKPSVNPVMIRPRAPHLVPASKPSVNPVTLRPIAPNVIPTPKPYVNPVTLRPIAPNLIRASKPNINPVPVRTTTPTALEPSDFIPATEPCVNPLVVRTPTSTTVSQSSVDTSGVPVNTTNKTRLLHPCNQQPRFSLPTIPNSPQTLATGSYTNSADSNLKIAQVYYTGSSPSEVCSQVAPIVSPVSALQAFSLPTTQSSVSVPVTNLHANYTTDLVSQIDQAFYDGDSLQNVLGKAMPSLFPVSHPHTFPVPAPTTKSQSSLPPSIPIPVIDQVSEVKTITSPDKVKGLRQLLPLDIPGSTSRVPTNKTDTQKPVAKAGKQAPSIDASNQKLSNATSPAAQNKKKFPPQIITQTVPPHAFPMLSPTPIFNSNPCLTSFNFPVLQNMSLVNTGGIPVQVQGQAPFQFILPPQMANVAPASPAQLQTALLPAPFVNPHMSFYPPISLNVANTNNSIFINNNGSVLPINNSGLQQTAAIINKSIFQTVSPQLQSPQPQAFPISTTTNSLSTATSLTAGDVTNLSQGNLLMQTVSDLFLMPPPQAKSSISSSSSINSQPQTQAVTPICSSSSAVTIDANSNTQNLPCTTTSSLPVKSNPRVQAVPPTRRPPNIQQDGQSSNQDATTPPHVPVTTESLSVNNSKEHIVVYVPPSDSSSTPNVDSLKDASSQEIVQSVSVSGINQIDIPDRFVLVPLLPSHSRSPSSVPRRTIKCKQDGKIKTSPSSSKAVRQQRVLKPKSSSSLVKAKFNNETVEISDSDRDDEVFSSSTKSTRFVLVPLLPSHSRSPSSVPRRTIKCKQDGKIKTSPSSSKAVRQQRVLKPKSSSSLVKAKFNNETVEISDSDGDDEVFSSSTKSTNKDQTLKFTTPQTGQNNNTKATSDNCAQVINTNKTKESSSSSKEIDQASPVSLTEDRIDKVEGNKTSELLDGQKCETGKKKKNSKIKKGKNKKGNDGKTSAAEARLDRRLKNVQLVMTPEFTNKLLSRVFTRTLQNEINARDDRSISAGHLRSCMPNFSDINRASSTAIDGVSNVLSGDGILGERECGDIQTEHDSEVTHAPAIIQELKELDAVDSNETDEKSSGEMGERDPNGTGWCSPDGLGVGTEDNCPDSLEENVSTAMEKYFRDGLKEKVVSGTEKRCSNRMEKNGVDEVETNNSKGEEKEKDSSENTHLRLSFYGDVDLLNKALVECTVPLVRVSVPHDEIPRKRKQSNEKSECNSKKPNISLSGDRKKCKVEFEHIIVPRKRSYTRPTHQRENLKKSRTADPDDDILNRKGRTRPHNAPKPDRNRSRIMKPPSSDENGSFIAEEWIPTEVTGDLTVKGSLVETSVKGSGRKLTRRSSRIKQKPQVDYLVLQGELFGLDTEERSVGLLPSKGSTVEEGSKKSHKTEESTGIELEHDESPSIEEQGVEDDSDELLQSEEELDLKEDSETENEMYQSEESDMEIPISTPDKDILSETGDSSSSSYGNSIERPVEKECSISPFLYSLRLLKNKVKEQRTKSSDGCSKNNGIDDEIPVVPVSKSKGVNLLRGEGVGESGSGRKRQSSQCRGRNESLLLPVSGPTELSKSAASPKTKYNSSDSDKIPILKYPVIRLSATEVEEKLRLAALKLKASCDDPKDRRNTTSAGATECGKKPVVVTWKETEAVQRDQDIALLSDANVDKKLEICGADGLLDSNEGIEKIDTNNSPDIIVVENSPDTSIVVENSPDTSIVVENSPDTSIVVENSPDQYAFDNSPDTNSNTVDNSSDITAVDSTPKTTMAHKPVVPTVTANSNGPDTDTSKSNAIVHEGDDCHYSSESDSDLFDEERDASTYVNRDRAHKMYLLMKRHNEVTTYLIRNSLTFSTSEVGSKTIHACNVCTRFRTNGVFRLFRHLKNIHRIH